MFVTWLRTHRIVALLIKKEKPLLARKMGPAIPLLSVAATLLVPTLGTPIGRSMVDFVEQLHSQRREPLASMEKPDMAYRIAVAQQIGEPGLSPTERMIGEGFEMAVTRDADARRYMLEFSDPMFFSHTSKLRKIWGRATVHDGQTLTVAGERIQLAGIRAPEISLTCNDKVLNLPFDAGGFALGRLKSGAPNTKAVICYVEDVKPKVGTCFIWGFFGPINIARRLVREGAAWAASPDASLYVRDEGWAEGYAAATKDPPTKNLWHTDCRPPSRSSR